MNNKIEIIIDANIMRKYFTCYLTSYIKNGIKHTDNSNIYVYCNDSELFDIIKKVNPYYFDYVGLTYGLNFIFVNIIEDYFEVCGCDNGIEDDECISFSFDTEEEALYFSLKYS